MQRCNMHGNHFPSPADLDGLAAMDQRHQLHQQRIHSGAARVLPLRQCCQCNMLYSSEIQVKFIVVHEEKNAHSGQAQNKNYWYWASTKAPRISSYTTYLSPLFLNDRKARTVATIPKLPRSIIRNNEPIITYYRPSNNT